MSPKPSFQIILFPFLLLRKPFRKFELFFFPKITWFPFKIQFFITKAFVTPKCLIGDVIFITFLVCDLLWLFSQHFNNLSCRNVLHVFQPVVLRRVTIHLRSMCLWLVYFVIPFFLNINLLSLQIRNFCCLEKFYHGYLLLQEEFPECDSISDISSSIGGDTIHISCEDLHNDSISASSPEGTGIQTDWRLLWWKNLKDFNEVLLFPFLLSLLMVVQPPFSLLILNFIFYPFFSEILP